MEMPNSSVKEPISSCPKSYVGRFVKLPMDSHGSMKACLVKFCSLRGNANVMKNPDTPIMTMNSPRLETRG